MSRPELRPGVARLFRLALRRRSELTSDAQYEITFHLEERAAQLVARGMTPDDARAEALRRFGDIEQATSHGIASSRRVERRTAFREYAQEFAQDARFAFRSLRRAPGFVALAIACLSLGIGANVAMFAVVDGVLLKPLPYQRPAQLVRIWSEGAVPPGIFEIVERENRSFAALGGVEGPRQLSMTGAGEPVRVTASQTTAGFFDVLGVKPALGRAFLSNESSPASARVAVISYGMWQSRFGGDSRVIGKSIRLDGVSRTIVGVMSPHFALPAATVDLWMPATFVPGSPSYWWSTYFTLVGRLKPGVTATQAATEAAVVFPRARKSFPMRMPDDWGRGVDVVPLQQWVVTKARPVIVLLYSAVAVVLLIACVNVAALCMGRTLSRAREIAVRTALGAGRGRITRLLLVENFGIAAVGALIGLACAWGVVRSLLVILPPETPRLAEIAIGGRALAVTMMLAALSAILSGLLPVLRLTSRDFSAALKSEHRTGETAGTVRVASTLAVAQVALAVTLVASAGLLVKSLWQLQRVDLGFDPTGVLTAEVPLPSFANDTATRALVFEEALLQHARAIPGVSSVAIASSLPFGDGIQGAAMEVESNPTRPGEVPPTPQLSAVSADYFTALRIPLRQGRLLTADDRAGSLRVGVIDEAAAHALWPNGNAIGQRIRYVWNKDWITIVGIVGNVKRDSLSSRTEPSLYLPIQQGAPRPLRIMVRTPSPARVIAPLLHDAVSSVDATVPMSTVRSLDEIVAGSASQHRFVAMLLASFAGVALLLGAVGIYGVVSASVARRTREIGVRMALGATSEQVLTRVLRQGLAISGTGAVLGLVGAIGFATLLRGLLFGVGVADIGVLVAVIVLLTIVAVGAALAPALRASRVDPLLAIRAE